MFEGIVQFIIEGFFEGILGWIFRFLLNVLRLIGAVVMSLFTLFQKSISHFYKKGEESSIPYLIGFFLICGIIIYQNLK